MNFSNKEVGHRWTKQAHHFDAPALIYGIKTNDDL